MWGVVLDTHALFFLEGRGDSGAQFAVAMAVSLPHALLVVVEWCETELPLPLLGRCERSVERFGCAGCLRVSEGSLGVPPTVPSRS